MTQPLTKAEYGLLGAAIISRGELLDSVDFDSADFRDPAMEEAWDVIARLRANGQPVDMTTVSNQLRPEILAANPSLLQDATQEAPDATTAAYYAHIVTENGVKRKIDAVGRVIANLSTQQGDGQELVDLAYQALDKKLGKITGFLKFDTLADGMQDTIDSLNDKPTYIETPWDDLNHLIHGWAPGRLYVVGARPSVGKTVFGVQAALALTNMGPVAYTSMEMAKPELQKRAISYIARIDMGRIQKHNIDHQHHAQIEAARKELDNRNFHIDPSENHSLAQIIRYARNLHRRQGIAGMVIDYVGLIDRIRGMDERETITEASKKLKQLAVELNIPIIVLSQLNRGIEGRDKKEPRLSDLRMSGSLEQDADVVILLHRDLREAAHEIKIIVAKNRQGMTGDMTLDFAGHYSEIRNQPPHGGF